MIENLINRYWNLYNSPKVNPYYTNQQDYKREIIIKIEYLKQVIKNDTKAIQ